MGAAPAEFAGIDARNTGCGRTRALAWAGAANPAIVSGAFRFAEPLLKPLFDLAPP